MLNFIYSFFTLQSIIWAIVILPLAGAIINTIIAGICAGSQKLKCKALVCLVGVLAPILSFAAAIAVFFTLTGFEATQPTAITGALFKWVVLGDLIIGFGLNVDQLSLLLALVITGVASMIHIYSATSLGNEVRLAKYFALISFSLFFVLLVVLADNMVLLLIGWEGLALSTYFLTKFGLKRNATTDIYVFMMGRFSGLTLLVAIFLIYGIMTAASVPVESYIFNFDTIRAYGPFFLPLANIFCPIIFVAAAAFCALIPFHVWLPRTKDAPIPAMAFIQNIGPIMAGFYLIARLNFIFTLSPLTLQIMAYLGAVCATYAAILALTENNIAKLLSYSTISQVGLIFLATGVGAFAVSTAHLSIHAVFGALLFLSAGSVVTKLGGESDIRLMGGLKRRMPVTTWTFVIAALSLAAVAPTSGFFTTNAILWQAYDRGHALFWFFGFLSMGLSAFFIFRIVGNVFFGTTNIEAESYKKLNEPTVSMLLPQMVLATAVVFGAPLLIPKRFGGADILMGWLSKVTSYEVAHAPKIGSNTEIILMVIGVLWAAHFAILAWVIYSQKRDWPDRIAAKMGWIHKIVENGFYFESLINCAIIRPLVWLFSKFGSDVIDKTILDGVAIGGIGRACGFASSLAVAMQRAAIKKYMVYFLIGAVLIVAFLSL